MKLKRLKRINSILFIIALFLFCSATTKATEKIPNYKQIKLSDLRQANYIMSSNNNIKKIRMSELENNIIVRFLNTYDYSEIYLDNEFYPRTISPYIEVSLKTNRILKIYNATQGFVIIENGKKYLLGQSDFKDFYWACLKKYQQKPVSQSKKYIPISYRLKDLTSDFTKENITFTKLKEYKNGMFSVPVKKLLINTEEICINEFKDEIAMEIASMRVRGDGFTISGVGMVEWVNRPHFYKKGNVIVYYIGDNENILKLLIKCMGHQYAGD